eukprot:4889406-Prymnesium_polylepis.2
MPSEVARTALPFISPTTGAVKSTFSPADILSRTRPTRSKKAATHASAMPYAQFFTVDSLTVIAMSTMIDATNCPRSDAARSPESAVLTFCLRRLTPAPGGGASPSGGGTWRKSSLTSVAIASRRLFAGYQEY